MKKSKAYSEANPGARPLIPDGITQKAITFIQEYKRGAFEVRKDHACKAAFCGMEYDTEQELLDHQKLLHADLVVAKVVEDDDVPEADPF
jgi:hypothetical protein